ncbi:DUF4407 domain-containing protein [Polymorphospora rubra]|uniref:DUF4407 domain-containing protein n=1 Tax=Polymorphospora rubra TaxID=338584 RepID=UPI001BB3EFC2|nr:DUF4407 domain-containing protein [Polymorphospora rubra]
MNVVWVVAAFVGGLLLAVLSDLISDEVRGRLDQVPFQLLRLAARRLPAQLRNDIYLHEWMPELHHILRREEAKPITRLYHGLRFAAGLLRSGPQIARELGDTRKQRLVAWAPGRWLRTMTGVDERLLDRVPQERLRYTGLGLLVVTTGLFSAVTMASAFTLLQTPWWFVIPTALLWGGAIALADRWLISSQHGRRNKRRMMNLVYRLVCATVVGIVLGEPILMKIFEVEINRQVRADRLATLTQYEADLRMCNQLLHESTSSRPLGCASMTLVMAPGATQQEIDTLIGRQVSALRESYGPVGLLDKVKALESLSGRSWQLRFLMWMIQIMALTIACLPIIALVMARKSRYDHLYLQENTSR